MQYDKILAAAALLMAGATLGVVALSPGIPVGTSAIVPIERLSRKIGDWSAQSEQTEKDFPAELKQKLPTAKIVDRRYTNRMGVPADVMLLTAANQVEFHDPTVCFPDQGFSMENHRTWRMDGQPVESITVNQPGQTLYVLYWWAGDFQSEKPHPAWLTGVYRLRSRIQNEEGARIFVRLMCADSPEGRADLQELAKKLITPVQRLSALSQPS